MNLPKDLKLYRINIHHWSIKEIDELTQGMWFIKSKKSVF